MNNSSMKIFSGTSNPELAQQIAEYLSVNLSKIDIQTFKDGEKSIKIKENVRGQDVFIIQSTSNPADEHIMELLLIIDAALRASSNRITAVIPYFGYSRQDRKVEPRVPISAKVVANIIQATGASRVLTLDLHADQIQGFFDIPVDNLFASALSVDYIDSLSMDNIVVVSPDSGGAARARFLAHKLNAGLAIIDKRRPKPNVSEVQHVVGEVEGKNCILVDDMVDTGGSISEAALALKNKGANDVYCLFTHALLTGDAIFKMEKAGFKEIICTNSIRLDKNKIIDNLKVLSIAPLLGEAIRRIHNAESVSSLFL